MEILKEIHKSAIFFTPTVVEESDFAKRYAIELQTAGLKAMDISDRMGVDPLQIIQWLEEEL